jgi:hypothetical protein
MLCVSLEFVPLMLRTVITHHSTFSQIWKEQEKLSFPIHTFPQKVHIYKSLGAINARTDIHFPTSRTVGMLTQVVFVSSN